MPPRREQRPGAWPEPTKEVPTWTIIRRASTFEDYLFGRGLAERTVGEYAKWVRRARRWCFQQGVDLDSIFPHHLRAWSETTPASWSSRKQARTSLAHYYAWIGRTDGVTDAIRVPRKPRQQCRSLTPAEASLLRDAATMVGGRQGLATLIGLYSAARAGEISGMRWDGWDGARLRWWRTKTSDWHEVPAHPVLAAALDAAREKAWAPTIFPGDHGREHVGATTVWSWVGDVGRAAGVKVTPHQLRATALSTALDATGDLRAVMTLAGHRDPAVTAGYTRTTATRLGSAIDALDYNFSSEDGGAA